MANTAANRRVTFRASSGRGAGHHQFRGLPVFLLALALTSGALALLQAATPSPSLALELAVLTAANLAASVLRFLLLRSFVFRSRKRSPA